MTLGVTTSNRHQMSSRAACPQVTGDRLIVPDPRPMFHNELETGASRVDPGGEQQISSSGCQISFSLDRLGSCCLMGSRMDTAPQCSIVTVKIGFRFECWQHLSPRLQR